MKYNLGERFIQWALADARVVALVRIGSRVRGTNRIDGADAFSDFDFQIVTTDSEIFSDRAVFAQSGIGTPLAHVVRAGRLGTAQKVTTIFHDGELDVVLIPAGQLEMVRGLPTKGYAMADPRVRHGIQDLASVLVGGFEILKGGELVGPIYEYIRHSVPIVRMDDRAVRDCAEAFVCDYVSVQRKVARGEFLAAQRWLHHHLAESVFKLLHELRQRRGELSFPDARRIEALAGEGVSSAVGISASPSPESILTAADKAGGFLRTLVRDLIGDKWTWPDLSALRLRAE